MKKKRKPERVSIEMAKKVGGLKPKKIKGQIATLKAMPYKGNMVYIRMIGTEIFEYLVIFNNQIYSSYMVIKPKLGCVKLTKDEIAQSMALIWAGAEATIDALLGVELDKEKADVVKIFEHSRKNVEGVVN